MINLPPNGIELLTEPASIALAKGIEGHSLATSLSDREIITTYVRQGKGGTPILLLHGFDSSVLEWRRLLPLLSANGETWAIDLLGFGFTERLSELPFSATSIKTHLYEAWKALIDRPAIFVGASMGGASAIDFALSYPDAVEKLILIDSAGFACSAAIGKFLFPPLDYLATTFLRSPVVRRGICKNAYHDPVFATLDARMCASLHLEQPGWQQAMIAFTKSGGYGSFREQLHQIKQNVLILWGACDRILGTEDAKGFQNAIPTSKLVWIENCGHVPHLEKPQITAQHILEFIDL